MLAELGVVGFALYAWLLGALAWALVLVTRRRRLLGLGLSSVLLVVFVHSLLYAGFFEDPLVWGVLGLSAAVLSSSPALQGVGCRSGARAPATTGTLNAA